MTLQKMTVLLALFALCLTTGCYRPAAADGGFYNPPVEKFKAEQAIDAGNYAEAEARLDKVLRNDPQDWGGRYLMGVTYLEQNRPVSGNRGYVQRLAKGKCFAKLWSEQRIVMTLACDTIKLDLTLTRQTSERWIAVVMR